MDLLFTPEAWEDYLYWQSRDKKMLQKINRLLKEIARTPFEGSGKPESLRYELQGCWSRRIDREHRLVYEVYEDRIHVLVCRYHY